MAILTVNIGSSTAMLAVFDLGDDPKPIVDTEVTRALISSTGSVAIIRIMPSNEERVLARHATLMSRFT